jgi:hypothetical protein
MLLLLSNFMGCVLIVCAECLCDGIRRKCLMLDVNRDAVMSPASHCDILNSSHACGYHRNKKFVILQITPSSSSFQVKGISHALETDENSRGAVESLRMSTSRSVSHSLTVSLKDLSLNANIQGIASEHNEDMLQRSSRRINH